MDQDSERFTYHLCSVKMKDSFTSQGRQTTETSIDDQKALEWPNEYKSSSYLVEGVERDNNTY